MIHQNEMKVLSLRNDLLTLNERYLLSRFVIDNQVTAMKLSTGDGFGAAH